MYTQKPEISTLEKTGNFYSALTIWTFDKPMGFAPIGLSKVQITETSFKKENSEFSHC